MVAPGDEYLLASPPAEIGGESVAEHLALIQRAFHAVGPMQVWHTEVAMFPVSSRPSATDNVCRASSYGYWTVAVRSVDRKTQPTDEIS